MARWYGMHALWCRWFGLQDRSKSREARAVRPLEMPRLPKAIHGQSRHGVRTCTASSPQGTSGRLPAVVVRKRHQSQSAFPRAEISLKAAWFLSHRVREAMRETHFARSARRRRLSKPMKPISAAKSGISAGRSGARTISAPSGRKWYSSVVVLRGLYDAGNSDVAAKRRRGSVRPFS